MEIKNNVYSSIEQITGQYLIQKTKESKDAAVSQTISFEDMLRQEWQNNSKDTTTMVVLNFQSMPASA